MKILHILEVSRLMEFRANMWPNFTNVELEGKDSFDTWDEVNSLLKLDYFQLRDFARKWLEINKVTSNTWLTKLLKFSFRYKSELLENR